MGRNALDPLGSYVSPKQQGSTGGHGPLEGFKILLTCPYGNPRTSQHNSDTSRYPLPATGPSSFHPRTLCTSCWDPSPWPWHRVSTDPLEPCIKNVKDQRYRSDLL